MSSDPQRIRAARICFVQTLVVLILGLLPIPLSWARARSMLDSARSRELNHADRESTAGGYYQGLIGIDGTEGSTETWVKILGRSNTNDSNNQTFARKVKQNIKGDFLMFELRPNVDKMLFNHPFRTNAYGMRDRPYSLEKPQGIFRIIVVGSSIDMGWGVAVEQTYIKQLEDWLNTHAAKRGLSRRFEILNFAVAAYSPEQRLEVYRRKASAFKPDLVLYSSTMLDIRLMEIHLCDLFECRVNLKYDFLKKGVANAGITAHDVRRDSAERLLYKELIKKKLKSHYWDLYDATLRTLAADCHSAGAPLACAIIPRVGKADAPEVRAKTVEHLREIITRHADALLDASGTFDGLDSEKVQIAPGDDHPNEIGHRRLFRSVADAIVKDTKLYETLFPDPESDQRSAVSGPPETKGSSIGVGPAVPATLNSAGTAGPTMDKSR